MLDPTRKTTNMKEIAETLGVSAVSVSLALRNSPRVSESLKERVFKLAGDGNFKVRRYPKMRSGRKKFNRLKIAVLYREDPSDPVAQTILNAVMTQLVEREMNFKVLDVEEALADPFLTVDFGGFLYYYDLEPSDIPRLAGKPQVAIMNDYFDCTGFDNCKVHNELAGKLAAEYLLGRGFRRILICYEWISTGMNASHPRLRGCRTRLEEVGGIEISELHYSRKSDIAPFARDLIGELDRDERPLGIFAFNDLTAFQVGSILDLSGRGFAPDKREMICCDNTFLISSMRNRIPVIDLHIGRIARAAVDRLIHRFSHPEEDFVEILFKPDLVLPERETAESANGQQEVAESRFASSQ